MDVRSRRERRFRAYDARTLDRIGPLAERLTPDERLELRAVAQVFPFRVNDYVIEELIDWDRVPDDPIYRLTFPHRDMLSPDDLSDLVQLMSEGHEAETRAKARQIQTSLNPHPSGQLTHNVPLLDGVRMQGMQHKYRETLLFFPAQGQTCHSYCTYCFRWPQFVGLDELKFANREAGQLVAYLRAHPEVTSVLFTGGDPLIMKTSVLRRYIEPLLSAELDQLTTIRLGTKSPAYWPYRFVTDDDADDLIRLFEDVRASGRHLALMAHISHPRELETPIAQAAIRRVLGTGAVVRCQAPLVRHVNDDPKTWSDLWRLEVRLGAVPYYMFVERDTGPRSYFEIPLVRTVEIFRDAYSSVSGLARTVRGPSMSAMPGKVMIDGVAEVGGQKVFVLHFLQARDPDWVGRPFFAKLDETATWFDQLHPAFESEFFFERRMDELGAGATGWHGRPERRVAKLFRIVDDDFTTAAAG
ncbi:MAG: lysine 2,3-aminomutase [Deltaproteobacteria bacterium]|nr:lysine 2,3-aminomutase [Deltaproteobacteria bacterium]